MERHDLNLRKVVMTPDDIKNIEEFFGHFKIKVPVHLQKVLDKFKGNPTGFTFDDQCQLRAFIAHTMVSSDHPLLTDKVFGNIRANCDKAWFEAQFDMDVEEVFTEGKEEVKKV